MNRNLFFAVASGYVLGLASAALLSNFVDWESIMDRAGPGFEGVSASSAGLPADSFPTAEIGLLDNMSRKIDDVLLELAAVKERLVSLDLPREPVPGNITAQEITTESWKTLQSSLKKLQENMQRIAEGKNESLHDLMESHKTVQWKKLEALNQEAQGDTKELVKKLKLMSYQDVIRNFGPPREVWMSKRGKIFWSYNRPVGHPSNFMFAFLDGYVVEAYTEP